MYKKITFIILSLLCLSAIASANETKIEAFKAPFYLNQSVLACGKLAEIKHFKNRHYLNLDAPFPKQTLTLLIWDNHYPQFEEKLGKLDQYLNRRFCALGVIEQYNDQLQIKLSNPHFLRLMTP